MKLSKHLGGGSLT